MEAGDVAVSSFEVNGGPGRGVSKPPDWMVSGATGLIWGLALSRMWPEGALKTERSG